MNLLELQRRMEEDVRRPLTAEYEMQTMTEEGVPVEQIAASYISPNSRLTSFERLEIYNRQYWFRLVAAVTEDYPTLNAVLGSKKFDALVLAYLHKHPSVSWTLRDLGGKLPSFLKAHPELAGRRHRLAVDVANLELAYVDAFDGQHVRPITDEEVRAIGPDSKLSLQPHIQLLDLAYPVDTLVLTVKKGQPDVDIVSNASTFRALQRRTVLPPMKKQAVYLVVHRFDDSVYYRRIERETFVLLRALRTGSTVSEAVFQAFANTKLDAEGQAGLIGESFAHASELGWLCPWRNEEPEIDDGASNEGDN